uniref:Uncharacterized protein n=1 Tax=Anguilla anguilla TaxID=7936 RepID=A0A0E9U3X6_ANGAN
MLSLQLHIKKLQLCKYYSDNMH